MKFKIEDGQMKQVNEDKSKIESVPTPPANPFNEIVFDSKERAVNEIKKEYQTKQQAQQPQSEINEELERQKLFDAMQKQVQIEQQQAQQVQAQQIQQQAQQVQQMQQQAQLQAQLQQQALEQAQYEQMMHQQRYEQPIMPQVPPQFEQQLPQMPITPIEIKIVLIEGDKVSITLQPNELDTFMNDLDNAIQEGVTFRVDNIVMNTKQIKFYVIG